MDMQSCKICVRLQCSLLSAVMVLAVWLLSSTVSAQPPVPPPANDATVKLNLPPEVELRVLVDYVSQRLGIKILYDEQIANKKITIKAPGEIPPASLLGLLQSALRMKGLALVDAAAPGWKRIVPATDLPRVAPTGEAEAAIKQFGAETAVTQAFRLKHVEAQKLDAIIKPFLSQSGANSVTYKELNLLIVTDYASSLLKISKLVDLIDRARPDVVLEFYTAKNVEAAALAQQLTALLSSQSKVQGAGSTSVQNVEVSSDARTNQAIFIGLRKDVDEALKLIQTLDQPLGVTTEVYRFNHMSAERMDRLAKDLINPLDAKRLYKATVDRDDNLLIVTSTPAIHRKLAELRRTMDVASARPQSPVRFYKIKNISAAEMLEALQAVQGDGKSRDRRTPQQNPDFGRIRPEEGLFVPGANRQPPAPPSAIQEPVPPPAMREDPNTQREASAQSGLAGLGLLGSAAKVSADPSTNSLIVVAEPSVQEIYAELIRALDRRRPQVIVEAKIVILDAKDDFSLGIEVSIGDRNGVKRLLEFTSYGLSKVDPVTGALALVPGTGLNWTLVDPDEADAVLRALAQHSRARVVSAPRLLVNDNATGTLTSVQEVPFNSVNASQTVATTSFAGFAEAGTTISVTPRISEGDHLQLDYKLTLNNFTGTSTEGLPPPRHTDQVESKVTIPDGHTIIVGGLNNYNGSSNYKGIPFIENIPILRELTGIQTTQEGKSSLFVFLRPVILRDDKFKDLKFISAQEIRKADIQPQFPVSAPLITR